jgi:hypothetical protein
VWYWFPRINDLLLKFVQKSIILLGLFLFRITIRGQLFQI